MVVADGLDITGPQAPCDCQMKLSSEEEAELGSLSRGTGI